MAGVSRACQGVGATTRLSLVQFVAMDSVAQRKSLAPANRTTGPNRMKAAFSSHNAEVSSIYFPLAREAPLLMIFFLLIIISIPISPAGSASLQGSYIAASRSSSAAALPQKLPWRGNLIARV